MALCTICRHPQRAAIDQALVAGNPYRSVAKQFSASESAMQRHKTTHLPASLADAKRRIDAERGNDLAVQQAAQRTAEATEGLDLFAELTAWVRETRLLRDACDRWLRDPDDATRYDVGARAEDIAVIYMPDPEGKGKPRRAPLSELLKAAERGGVLPIAAETKGADPRELILKAQSAARGHMELLVNVMEKLHGARQMQAFEGAVLDAIAEVDPDARARILASLDASERLRALTGWDTAAGDPRPGNADRG